VGHLCYKYMYCFSYLFFSLLFCCLCDIFIHFCFILLFACIHFSLADIMVAYSVLCFMLLSHFLNFSHHIKLCCSPNKWLSLLVAQKVRSRNNFCSSNKTFALYSSGVFLHSKYFALSAIQNPNQHLQWCVCYDPPSAKVIPLWLVNC